MAGCRPPPVQLSALLARAAGVLQPVGHALQSGLPPVNRPLPSLNVPFAHSVHACPPKPGAHWVQAASCGASGKTSNAGLCVRQPSGHVQE